MDPQKAQDGDEVAKKSPYDDLTKEDLIRKCKGLLVIAQKTKQLKSELQAENEEIKGQLQGLQKQQTSDKQNCQALQEIVDTITQQKLDMITAKDDLKKQNASLKAECERQETKIATHEKSINELKVKLANLEVQISDLDSENISLKRQNVRFEKDNEGLINQLDVLEKQIGEMNKFALEQREQLLALEQNAKEMQTSSDSLEQPVSSEDLTKLSEKIEQLTSDLEDKDKNNEETFRKLQASETKLREVQNLYDTEREKRDKANIKLRCYRDKIVRCASSITELKNTKFILLKTIKDYAGSIPKWQNDILNVSKILNDKYVEVTNENNDLKEKLRQLELTLRNSNSNEIIDGLKKEREAIKSELIKLKDEYDSIKKDTGLYKENIEANNTELNRLSIKLKSSESEKLILVKEKQSSKDALSELETRYRQTERDNELMKSQILELKASIEQLQRDKNAMSKALEKEKVHEISKQNMNKVQSDLDKMKADYKLLENEYRTILDTNELLKDQVNTLKISLEQPPQDDSNLTEVNESLQADLLKLETKLSAYKQENSSLLIEMKESRQKCKEAEKLMAESAELNSKLSTYKTENSELLNDMKEMNQVMKERGETISKQQTAIKEMERLIETIEQEHNVSSDRVAALELEIAASGQTVALLKEDKERLNEAVKLLSQEKEELVAANKDKEETIVQLRDEVERLKQSGAYCPSEDMSTSTISKAEEYSRMKELDETFEERYTKLRLFAVKLKKRVNELTQQLQKAEASKTTDDADTVDGSRVAKNLQSLQHECDKLTDVVEEKNEEIKKLVMTNEGLIKDVERLQSELSSAQVTGQTLESSAQQNKALDIMLKEYQQQIQEMKKKLDAAEKKNEGLTVLKAELANKDLQLSNEIEQHRLTKEQLDKTKRDVKKKSVLSLEMEDYERSMKELTVKMEDNKKKMVQMESTIDTQQATIHTLKTQIKLLEEQIKAEETQNRMTKEELHAAQDQLKERDETISAKTEAISNLELTLEEMKQVKEELNVQMASVLGEKEKVGLVLSQEKAEVAGRLKKAEAVIVEMEESLRIKSVELDELKTEFASYKVRAQSVLRQNQVVDHSAEERLREESAALKAEVESLKAQLQANSSQMEQLRSSVTEERRRSAEATASTARMQQRVQRLEADAAKLADETLAQGKQHRLQLATLTQCYKAQQADLETRLQTETAALQLELRTAREALASTASQAIVGSGGHSGASSDVDAELSVAMLPREEGEGSEWAPSPPPAKTLPGRRSPLPLERLLEQGVPEVEVRDASASLGLSAEQELLHVQRKMSVETQRVKHLTSLLAESEREAARLQQMGDLLKSELRRAQASAERLNHTHNAEYLKNVLLKFVTLPAGDERCRLVPVMQKILTLTQDEAHKLNAVAKGIDPNANKGWGSYLPWPGGR